MSCFAAAAPAGARNRHLPGTLTSAAKSYGARAARARWRCVVRAAVRRYNRPRCTGEAGSSAVPSLIAFYVRSSTGDSFAMRRSHAHSSGHALVVRRHGPAVCAALEGRVLLSLTAVEATSLTNVG